MEDFNANIFELSMTSFCTLFKLKNIVKELTCYKNPENPICIGFHSSFHNTCVYETRLTDFHNLITTICEQVLNHCLLKLLHREIKKILMSRNFNVYSRNV